MAAKPVPKKPEPKKLKPKGETMEEQQHSLVLVTILDNHVQRFGPQMTQMDLGAFQEVRNMLLEEEGEPEEEADTGQ